MLHFFTEVSAETLGFLCHVVRASYFDCNVRNKNIEVALRSRRLEVVGERENGRARTRHSRVSFSRAHFFLSPATSKTPAKQASIEAAGDPVVRTLALALVMVNSDATRGRARPGGSYSYIEKFSFTRQDLFKPTSRKMY